MLNTGENAFENKYKQLWNGGWAGWGEEQFSTQNTSVYSFCFSLARRTRAKLAATAAQIDDRWKRPIAVQMKGKRRAEPSCQGGSWNEDRERKN